MLVVENGYLAKDPYWRREEFAIAIGDHNGAGRWYVGGPERWQRMNVRLWPWRKQGGRHVLVREQRGIGSALMASPKRPMWHEDVMKRLRAVTDRPIRLRKHSGVKTPATPLLDDLAGCHAVVTWASSMAVRALTFGVQVFYEAPHWICEDAGVRGIQDIESPDYGDRIPAFERLAWAQWHVDEIAAGLPFDYLLSNEMRQAA